MRRSLVAGYAPPGEARDRPSETSDVRQIGRLRSYPAWSRDDYLEDVDEPEAGQGGTSEWAKYIRSISKRPDWSVARLARESQTARSTLFRWLKDGGERVTIEKVRQIAHAAGDDVEIALKAAGNLLQREPLDPNDPVVKHILALDIDAEMREMMLDRRREILALRQEQDIREADIIARRGAI